MLNTHIMIFLGPVVFVADGLVCSVALTCGSWWPHHDAAAISCVGSLQTADATIVQVNVGSCADGLQL